MSAGAFDAARQILADAVASKIVPGATAEVGSASGPLWQAAIGALSFDVGAVAVSIATPYDLASLTKPIVTATLAMQLSARGAIDLHAPVGHYFDDWRGRARETVTVRDLLEHASGLPARLLDRPPDGRRAFEHEICRTPLEYSPREASVYSDLGFILLGFLVSDVSCRPLDEAFDAARRILGESEPDMVQGVLGFAPLPDGAPEAAPTLPLDDDRRRGRRLAGEVHDAYAAALGGIAGHSGLFGTVGAVGAFARAALRASRGDRSISAPLSPDLVRLATTRSSVPGSSRALGWDTMRTTSSCGTRMSAAAFGHVGFTGTSLWIDPERDRYFVLLANRVCAGGTTEEIQAVRRAFHDAAGG